MRTFLIPAATVLFSAMTATAQSNLVVDNMTVSTVGTAMGTADDCVVRTTTDAWNSLGLSADQLTKVQDIQTSHRKDCLAVKQEKSMTDMAGTCKHETRIKEVLTADQYTKWQAWCAKQSSTLNTPESAPEAK